MSDAAIAKISDAPSAVAVNRSEFTVMREQAADLIASGYLPKAIDRPEKAVAIIMLGRELGMGPWQSFNSIDVIQGRPTLKPIGMAALVNRFVEQRGGYLRVVESSAERCVIEYLRPPAPEPRRVSFTTQEAQTAGLMGKDSWRQYPQDMLRSRAISRACREGFSDVILGLYTEEEVEPLAPASRPATASTAIVSPISVEVVSVGMGTNIDGDDPTYPPIVDDDRSKANRRYHAIGSSHGWTDEALHLLAVGLYPDREHGKTTSRSQLTAAELDDISDLMVSTIGRIFVAETGEYVPTPEVEFANAIARAEDQKTLAEIAARLKSGGHSALWLKRLWKHRNGEVPPVAESATDA